MFDLPALPWREGKKKRGSQGEQNSTRPGVFDSTGRGIRVQSEVEKKQKIRGKKYFVKVFLGDSLTER